MAASILPGKFKGKQVTVVDVFEGVGKHSAGAMTDAELHELEQAACHRRAVAAASSRHTMACVSEAIGLALPVPPARRAV